MTVTLCVGDDQHEIPNEDAARLAEELRLYAEGRRGAVTDAPTAKALAKQIDRHLAGKAKGVIPIESPAALDALHAVLNAIVHQMGPAMQLYSAVTQARGQAA